MDLLSSLGGPAAAERLMCSRRGCRAEAEYKLLWNNPMLHTPERRKIWLACEEHRDWLETYLRERLLYRETQVIDRLDQGPPADQSGPRDKNPAKE